MKIQLPSSLRLVTAEQLLERIRLTKAKGVVLNVWATWCGSCRHEMPLMLALKTQFPDLDFQFVSVDDIDKLIPVGERVKELGIARPTYVAMPPLGDFKAGLSQRWQGSLPSTFLFDPSGKLRYWWGAEVFESEIVPILTGFLKGEAIDGEANVKVRKGSGGP
jgi:thiol-disulfide isomerase/thioredoxin